MNKTIRWGIVGSGKIARKFASDLRLVNHAELMAVASRTQESADAFVKEFPAQYAYGSYEALAQNPEVDAVYIATPHPSHYENTLLCLNHSKAVLCEKPFAMNARQVTEMIALAKEKKVFLMEALWTKFLPHFEKTRQVIGEGLIGNIKSLRADFGFNPPFDQDGRLFNPGLGGGSLLDIGIYPVFLAVTLLGRPDEIQVAITRSSTGVDEQCAITFRYNNGALAQLFSTLTSETATDAVIHGDKGRLHLRTAFHNATSSVYFDTGRHSGTKEIFSQPPVGIGYEYEIRHVVDCLQKGLTESPVMTFADSLLLIGTLDKIREIAGIKYIWDDL